MDVNQARDTLNNDSKVVLIIGGMGGIGRALIGAIQNQSNSSNANIKIYATYHHALPIIQDDFADLKFKDRLVKIEWVQVDVTCESSIETLKDRILQEVGYVDWLINCVGVLATSLGKPEKSIKQVTSDFMLDNFVHNTIPTLLLAKHFAPLLKNSCIILNAPASPAIFATISARVGSICDNELGGWYSYRMSKAALNMGIKTLSIEWQRTLPQVCVLALQPGTVDTELSKPFQRNLEASKIFTPEECANHLLDVIQRCLVEDSGSFLDWKGELIPW